MAFTPKNWEDAPSTSTPLSAAALEDLETRLAAYTDTAAGASGGSVIQVAAPTGNSTTDRAAIQTALNSASAGDVARLAAGSVYTVNSQGTKLFTVTSGSTTLGFCIQIPSGVTLDLNGSTLRYDAAAGDVVMVCNTATNALTDTNVGLVGYGTIDGNANTLTNSTVVWFHGVTGMVLDVRLYNTHRYGLYMSSCSNVAAPRIHSNLCQGQAIMIGDPGNNTPAGARYVSSSWFGSIVSKNVTKNPLFEFNQPGNPIYVVMRNCTVDTMQAENGEAGLKIDRPSVDVQVGKVLAKTNSTNNSGLKLQGSDADPGYPLRVTVGEVHMVDQFGAGLWMDKCYDCTVGLYTGESNGGGGLSGDVWIGGVRDTINQVRTTNAGATGVQVRDYAVDYQIGDVTVLDANRLALASTNGVTIGANSKGSFGTVAVIDSGTPAVRHDRGLRQTASTSVFTVERLHVRGWITSAYTLLGGVTSAQQVVSGTDTYLRIGLASETIPGSTTADVILPLHGVYVAEAAQTGAVNRFYGARCRVPASGSIRGVSYFVTASSGNCIIAVYDTGQTTGGVYTKLGDSGSIAVGTISTWQTWDPGAGVINVTQGQDLILGVMFDNTTASVGRGANFVNAAASQLPTGSLSATSVLPKLSLQRTEGGFAAGATITEGNMLTNTMTPVFVGRVA